MNTLDGPKLHKDTWQSVALAIGERLATVGPKGYYDFTPLEWFLWARRQLPAGYKRVAIFIDENGFREEVQPEDGGKMRRIIYIKTADGLESKISVLKWPPPPVIKRMVFKELRITPPCAVATALNFMGEYREYIYYQTRGKQTWFREKIRD